MDVFLVLVMVICGVFMILGSFIVRNKKFHVMFDWCFVFGLMLFGLTIYIVANELGFYGVLGVVP